jgi:phage terminase large subunit GpA-like protein
MLRDRGAFFAEYQNDPIEEKREDELTLTADQICAKLSGIARGILTVDQGNVTAFIDVQKNALYWCVCGWGDNFSGNVVDYGIFPEQGRNYFTYSDLSVSLADAFPGKSEEGAIFAGLEVVVEALCSREWKRDDGTVSKLSRLMIDEGYQTEIIHQFCRSSKFSAIVMPSKGFGVKAGNKPMNDYQKRPGEKMGLNWRITTAEGRAQRYVMIDTNFWKSFLFSRLAVSRGGPGCLSLFGDVPIRHRLFAEHLKSEFSVKTFGRGRDVTEWTQKPGKPDNHWLDCLVGCCVGASISGVGLLAPARAPKQRVPLAQMGRT